MKLQDIFEDEQPPKRTRQPKKEWPAWPGPIDAKGNFNRESDRRPGFSKLQKARHEQHMAMATAFRAQMNEQIGSVVDRIKAQYADFKHDSKTYDQHAHGRWTLYVPQDAAQSVHQTLMSTLSQISGRAKPDFEGYPKMGNAWDSVDFHFVHEGVNATVSMQWSDVDERKSRAEHLNFPAFRVYGIGFSLGMGFSDVTYRDHPGQ